MDDDDKGWQMDFVAAGCTPARHMASLSYPKKEAGGIQRRVVYASGRSVLEASLSDAGDRQVIFHAPASITCLKTLACGDSECAVLVGCSDGSIVVHGRQVLHSTQAFASPIVCLEALAMERRIWIEAADAKGHCRLLSFDLCSDRTINAQCIIDHGTIMQFPTGCRITALKCLPISSHESGAFVLLTAITASNAIVAHLISADHSPSIRSLDGIRLEGHSNWISSLDLFSSPSFDSESDCAAATDAKGWLVSGSHDRTVRVWRLRLLPMTMEGKQEAEELIPLKNEDLVDWSCDQPPWILRFDLDTILIGHEDCVHSVSLRHCPTDDVLYMSTAGADGQLFVYALGDSWQPVHRVHFPVTKGASIAGDLYDAQLLFGHQANSGDADQDDGVHYYGVLCHNSLGSFLEWYQQPDSDQKLVLRPCVISGHVGPVTDVAHDAEHGVLFSCSEDRTVRGWRSAILDGRKGKDAASGWREISRPMIHGHAIRSLAILPPLLPKGTLLAVASEEKIVRLLEDVNDHCSISSSRGVKDSDNDDDCGKGGLRRIRRVETPPLGLSNHVVEDKYVTIGKHELTEGDLLHATLWPEVAKLYGHEDELYTMACPARGDIDDREGEEKGDLERFATAAKSSLAGDSVVRLWSRQSGGDYHQSHAHSQLFRCLAFPRIHNLTVVNLAFSPGGRWLLAVSRDRTASVYDGQSGALRCHLSPTPHKRIIWSGCWLDARSFVTASRDGLLCRWQLPGEAEGAARQTHVHVHPESITALSCMDNDRLMLGTESGRLYTIDHHELTNVRGLPAALGPCDTITRILLLPPSASINGVACRMAIGSRDHSMRVLKLRTKYTPLNPLSI